MRQEDFGQYEAAAARWKTFRRLGLVFALSLVAFLPALLGGFVWDDMQYVVQNQTLRTPQGLLQIWLSPQASPQYYPMTFTSFWFEWQTWGLIPFGYHLNNLLLHALNASLLYLLLRRWGGAQALAATLLFGIHPLRAESAAWISERKDVLSGFFVLLTLLFWSRQRDSERINLERGAEVVTGQTRGLFEAALPIFFFLLALLSKTAVCPLPCAMAVILWLDRKPTRRECLQLAPYFGLSLAAGLLHVYLEQFNIDASQELVQVSLLERILISGRNFWFYLEKTLLPYPLMTIYPKWDYSEWRLLDWIYPSGAAGMLAGLYSLRFRIGKGPVALALIYTVMILPALGLISQAFNRYAWAADHFQYLAGIPFLALLASGWGRLADAGIWGWRLSRVVLATVCAALMILSWRQSLLYADSVSLFSHNLRWNPDSWGVHTALGSALLQKEGPTDRVLGHYLQAVQLEPRSPQTHYNLAVFYSATGREQEAIDAYRKALEIEPEFAEAHNNLGILLAGIGRFEAAMEHFNRASQIKPWSEEFAANKDRMAAMLKAGKKN